MGEIPDDDFEKALRETYPRISAADQMLWKAYELDPEGLDRRKGRAKRSGLSQLGQQGRLSQPGEI